MYCCGLLRTCLANYLRLGRTSKGLCIVKAQLDLWNRLHSIIPEEIEVRIVGDGELGHVLVLEWMDH